MLWSSLGYSFIFGLSGAMMPGPLLAVAVGETLKRGFWAVIWLIIGHSLLELGVVALLVQTGDLASKQIVAGVVGTAGGAVLLWMTLGMMQQAGATRRIWTGVLAFAVGFHALMQSIHVDVEHFQVVHPWGLLIGIAALLGSGVWLERHMRRQGSSPKQAGDEYALARANGGLHRLGPLGLGIVVSLANPYFTLWWLTIGAKLVLDALTRNTAAVVAVYIGHIASDFAWYGLVGAAVVLGRSVLSSYLYRWVLALCAAILLRCGVYFFYAGVQFLF